MRFDARVETPEGLIDGTNATFRLSRPFTGEPVVFLNGLAKAKLNADGWTHDGVQVVTLKQAPVVGDSVQVWFTPVPK